MRNDGGRNTHGAKLQAISFGQARMHADEAVSCFYLQRSLLKHAFASCNQMCKPQTFLSSPLV